MENHRGRLRQKYKARWVLPRELGGRHIGLYRGKPLLNKASGRALWGASIPVISVTVMTTEEKTTLPAQGSRRVQDEEELYPGEENALRRGIHGSRPLPHHARGAQGQASEEDKTQQRAAEEAERPALPPLEVQKANANFTVRGFYLTLTYIDTFLPESMEQAQRDLRNYIRRVKAAIAKLYGPAPSCGSWA